MKSVSIANILELSVSERIQLVQDIWDSISCVPDLLDLSEKQQAELYRRIAAYHKNKNDTISWNDLKARIGL
jgi:putative addiction module component (TIGR02574 family)